MCNGSIISLTVADYDRQPYPSAHAGGYDCAGMGDNNLRCLMTKIRDGTITLRGPRKWAKVSRNDILGKATRSWHVAVGYTGQLRAHYSCDTATKSHAMTIAEGAISE